MRTQMFPESIEKVEKRRAWLELDHLGVTTAMNVKQLSNIDAQL